MGQVQEKYISNKKGFTLIEAIISLTLIGIVFVLVIFKVALNHDKEFESKFNKVSASIEANIQAYKLNHTGVTDSDFLVAAHHNWFVDAVKTGMSFENCNVNDCWSSTTNFNDGENDVVVGAGWDISKLKDETIIAIAPFSADNEEALLRNIDIYIDINGKKGPNTFGKDIRKFNYLYENNGIANGVAFVCPNNTLYVEGQDHRTFNNAKCKWGCDNANDHVNGVDNWSWDESTCNWIDTCSVARDADGTCNIPQSCTTSCPGDATQNPDCTCTCPYTNNCPTTYTCDKNNCTKVFVLPDTNPSCPDKCPSGELHNFNCECKPICKNTTRHYGIPAYIDTLLLYPDDTDCYYYGYNTAHTIVAFVDSQHRIESEYSIGSRPTDKFVIDWVTDYDKGISYGANPNGKYVSVAIYLKEVVPTEKSTRTVQVKEEDKEFYMENIKGYTTFIGSFCENGKNCTKGTLYYEYSGNAQAGVSPGDIVNCETNLDICKELFEQNRPDEDLCTYYTKACD